MDVSIKTCSLRLLQGELCSQEETPCAVEYQTGTGTATIQAAIKGLSDSIPYIKFLELEQGQWVMKLPEEEQPVSGEDIAKLLEEAGIALEQLKQNSKNVQQQIQEEKQHSLVQAKHKIPSFP